MTKVLGLILVTITFLCCGHAEGANLTIDPSWSTFHPGESVTFTCDMNEGKDSDWEYEIRRNGEQFLQSDQHKSYTLQPIQTDHSGEYHCCGVRKSSTDTKCSGTVSLNVTVTSVQPRAKLTPGPTTIPVGGSVTLRCSVEPPDGWKYRWFRKTKNTHEVQLTDEENRDINVTQGGIYRCMGVRGNTNFHSLISDEVNITITFSNEVVVTRQPNWPQIFSGETITLTCEVHGGETTEWTYEWRRDGTTVQRGNYKDWTVRVSESSSGDYMCQCRRRDDWSSVTKWSEKIPLLVSAQPIAKLTTGSTKIPIGGSVTLSCSVEPPAGWKYLWYRQTSDTPEVQLTDEENTEINVTQGGTYRCMGVRGTTNFYSVVSDEVIITKTLSNKVFVTRRPNWPQMFSGETITLTCEVQGGEPTEWMCEWRRSGKTVQNGNNKELTVRVSETSSGEYKCQCRRRDDWFSVTKWSEKIPVLVSVQPRAKLTPGPTTIPAGGSVTLRCSVEPSAGWKYRWFRKTKNSPEVQLTNEKNRDINVTQGGIYQCKGVRGNKNLHSLISDEVIITITLSNEVVVTRRPKLPQIFIGETITLTCEVQRGETTEWTYEWRRDDITVKLGNDKDLNVTISESNSGDYMCQCRLRGDWSSVTRWSEKITVAVSTPGSSSSPVLLIVGLVSGILLVLLLVVLWYYRRSKDLRWPGWKLLKRRFRVNNGFNNENDESSSALHGDDHIYESVNFSERSGNVVDKPRDVTYSLIELKNFGKQSTPNEPAEGAVYYCLEPGMEDRGSPGAKEEALYSEITSGPENNNSM